MGRKPFNEESKHVMGMDDFGEASDSCGEHQMNTDNGAGANANTSINDVISMTSNPLSELVWSPETGLSVKYSSDCNISTATTAVLWSAEKANFTVLPQGRNVNLLKVLDGSIDADIVTEKQSECILDIQVHGTDDPPAHTSLNKVDQQLQGDAKSVAAGSQVDGVPGISSKKMVKKKGIWELEPSCKTSSSNPGLDDSRATDVLKKKEVCYSSVVLNNDICYEEFNQVNDHNVQVKVSLHGPSSDTPAIKEQNFNEKPALNSMKYENNTRSTPPATSSFLDNIEFLSKDKIILRKSQSNEEVLRGEMESRKFDGKVLRGGMELKSSQSNEKVPRGEMEIGTPQRGEKAVVETECRPSSSKRKADTNEDDSNEEPTFARKRPFGGELKCVSENENVKTKLSSFVNWLSNLTHGNLKVEPDGELSLEGNLVKCHTEDKGKGYFVSTDKNQAAACASGGFEKFIGQIYSTNLKQKNLITEVIMDEITTSSQAQCRTNKQIAEESEHQPTTVHDQGFSLCSLNPESSSQQTRSFESMTSYFAQRLAAIKNFVQVGRKNFCFFCGVEGHMLQTCKKFLQPEQEDIRKKLNLSDEVQDESCLCIRCFQLNHWAIACPHVSSENS